MKGLNRLGAVIQHRTANDQKQSFKMSVVHGRSSVIAAFAHVCGNVSNATRS